jgi:hypothetical protein
MIQASWKAAGKCENQVVCGNSIQIETGEEAIF